MRKTTTILFTVGIALLARLSVQGATIAWGSPQNIAGDTDVSTDGTLINAVNLGISSDFGPTDTTTIKGVPFNGTTFGTSSVISGNFSFSTFQAHFYNAGVPPFSTLSQHYQHILSSDIDSSNSTLTISNLTISYEYQFEFWCSDSTPSNQPNTASAGSSITLFSNPSNVFGGLGQFAIGTFTADASTEIITFSSPGISNAYVNAAQFRQITAVPEPSTGRGLLTVGSCITCLLRRRRRVARAAEIER